MQITIVGTGNMARGIAARVLAGGHHVAFFGALHRRAARAGRACSTATTWRLRPVSDRGTARRRTRADGQADPREVLVAPTSA